VAAIHWGSGIIGVQAAMEKRLHNMGNRRVAKGVPRQATTETQVLHCPAAHGTSKLPEDSGLADAAWALGAMQLLPMPWSRVCTPCLETAAPAFSTNNSRPDPTCVPDPMRMALGPLRSHFL
jgi:hypothetical protein